MTHPTVPGPARTRPVAAAAAAALALLLAACAGSTTAADNPADESSASAAAGGPARGGRLSIAFTSDSGCLDPPQVGFIEDRIIIRQLADTLTDQDPETGEILPFLAESWEINADATEYTFHLVDGVTFADGTPLDAAAVKATFDAINALGATASVAGSLIRGFEAATVVDDRTVTITFSQPNAPFLQATTNTSLVILSPDSWNETPEDRCTGQWTGSGPFTLTSYIPQESASVDRRPGYAWGAATADNKGEAYLDGVDFSFIAEPSVQVGSLTSGQLDVAWPRAALSEDNQGLVEAAGGTIIKREMPGVSETQLPNVSEGRVLHDLYARQALVKAIDFAGIAKAEYWDGYPVPTSIIAATTPGWVDHADAYVYDPDGARALLEANGWSLDADGYYAKDGQRFTIEWLVFTNVSSQSTAALVQDQVKKAGIELVIKPLTSQEGAAVLEAGAYDIGNIASTRADPDILRTTLDTSYVSDASASKRSQSPEVAAQLTELFARQFSQTDQAERFQTVAEIQDLIIDQVAAFPLNARIQAFGVAARVHGLKVTAENLALLQDTWLDQ